MDRALNFLALAKKARLAELGEEPVGAITRTGKGYLVMVASDASDHTWRRAKSFVAGTEQQCIRLPFTKDELGFVVGRTSLAIAAITDVAMAAAFVKALPEPGKYAAASQALEQKAAKQKQRKDEAKAHQRNIRTGKKK
jgi:ribosomal protein L7Ae-like RNA K-turn-binding protein